MQPIEIQPSIYWIGVNDQKTKLFEGLWPIEKEGISYNSYLLKGDKNVLVDLCKETYQDDFLQNLSAIVKPSEIDYLVMNHMEPDHTGALQRFMQIATETKIICTKKAVPMIGAFYGIDDRIQAIEDGEKLSLGKMELQFFTAPMVHWPETMLTYETHTGTLFSCDAFGGYGTVSKGIFDSDYEDLSYFESESLRYFSNIVAAFSKPVLNAGKKLENKKINMIAPSHGLIWKENPGRIIDLYMNWSRFAKGPAEKSITILYGSMYGNTSSMVPEAVRGIQSQGIPVDVHDVTQTHISYILPDLWKNQGVMIGAPTYEGSIFPTMALALEMVKYKRIFNRNVTYFGGFGWGGGAMRYVRAISESLDWTLTDSLEFAGRPTHKNAKQVFQLGADLAKLINSIGKS